MAAGPDPPATTEQPTQKEKIIPLPRATAASRASAPATADPRRPVLRPSAPPDTAGNPQPGVHRAATHAKPTRPPGRGLARASLGQSVARYARVLVGRPAPPVFSALRRRVLAPSGSSPRPRRRFSSRALLRSLACGVCVCVSALQRALCLLQRHRQNKTKQKPHAPTRREGHGRNETKLPSTPTCVGKSCRRRHGGRASREAAPPRCTS